MIATAADRDSIAVRWDENRITIVALCAAWCDTCTEFRAAFERIAAAHQGALSIWLDIEDDAALCGEVEVENFPTLAIYRGARLLHYGVSLPQEATVSRLLDEMTRRDEPARNAPDALIALQQTLRAQRHAVR
jgi:thioredoxin reductase (NADPH)